MTEVIVHDLTQGRFEDIRRNEIAKLGKPLGNAASMPLVNVELPAPPASSSPEIPVVSDGEEVEQNAQPTSTTEITGIPYGGQHDGHTIHSRDNNIHPFWEEGRV